VSVHPARESVRFRTLRLGRYLFAGAASAAVDFALFNLMLLVFPGGVHWTLFANTVSSICGMAVNYTLNARLTFAVQPTRGSALRYVAMSIVALTLYNVNLLVLRSLVPDTRVWLNVAKVVALATTTAFNYMSARHVVFRRPSAKLGEA
jgi:putative flippase GtrA